ncbi:Imm8 family immunity protein [Gimesia sp.]|uniref:Imm8 family immunity protein n=1 Tax=Gimesia sp. TaxID=2024833 RepID=UPI003A8ED5C3
MLEVISFYFYDQEPDWVPPEPWDIHEMVSLTVGENGAGCNYEVQLCTRTALKRLTDKRHLFLLDEWISREDTIAKINQFIEETISKNLSEDPYQLLARYWLWEYEGMN